MQRYLKPVGGGLTPTGNAVETDVLAPKTFSNANGINKTGTMVERGNLITTIHQADQTFLDGHYSGITQKGDANLQPGYIMNGVTIGDVTGTHVDNAPSTGDATTGDVLSPRTFSNGSGTGLTGTLALSGNAGVADVLSGKTFYNTDAKTKVTGTIPSKTAQTYTPGTTDQTIASGQYLSGTQTVKGDANLTESNIRKDVTVFGKQGTLEPDLSMKVKDTLALNTSTLLVNGRNVWINAFYLADSVCFGWYQDTSGYYHLVKFTWTGALLLDISVPSRQFRACSVDQNTGRLYCIDYQSGYVYPYDKNLNLLSEAVYTIGANIASGDQIQNTKNSTFIGLPNHVQVYSHGYTLTADVTIGNTSWVNKLVPKSDHVVVFFISSNNITLAGIVDENGVKTAQGSSIDLTNTIFF